MKNLFNSPRFVAIMCFVAFAVVARTGYQQLFNGSDAVTNDSAFINSDLMGVEVYGVSTNTESLAINNSVHREQITWLLAPTRDPFTATSADKTAPVLAGARQQTTVSRPIEPQNNKSSVTLPVLKALFHNNLQGKAVIDGRLIEVGDRVSGFNVLAITNKYVVLEKHGSQFTLFPIRS